LAEDVKVYTNEWNGFQNMEQMPISDR